MLLLRKGYKVTLALSGALWALACGEDGGATTAVPNLLTPQDASTAPPDAGSSLPVTDSGLGAVDAAVVVASPGSDGGCGAVKAETEAQEPAVDVVWILDGSGSMLPHALAVGDNMLRFMDNVRASGADINVVMLTGVLFGPLLQTAISDTNYHWVLAEVQSHDAFRQALNAYDQYAQFLRPTAPTHFVVVTDDSSDMPANEFLPMMTSKLGHPFYFHSVSSGGLLSGDCIGSGPGTEYQMAAQSTMGDQISLCDDWGANFKQLEGSVIASAPLPCAYPIPAAPNGQQLDPQAVQVLYTPSGGADQEFAKASAQAQCADFAAWYFDDESAPKNVVLCPKACDTVQLGGAINIGFGCAPSIVLQ